MSRGPAYHARTHLPGGTDPLEIEIPSTATSLAATITGMTGLDAFWKLNEASGATVAEDSSGNNYDLITGAPYNAPAFGFSAGPPGETTAQWDGATEDRLYRTHHTGYTANFSALGWVNVNTGGVANPLIGQGAATHNTSSGWEFIVDTANKLALYIGKTSPSTIVVGDTALTEDTWYMWAVTRGASTWKMYLNATVQTNTSTVSPALGNTDTWLGNDGFNYPSGIFQLEGFLSYCALFSRELTAAEILEIYTAAGFGGLYPSGYVYTSDGAGNAYWAPSTIEVTY